jgi:hypothetical protein
MGGPAETDSGPAQSDKTTSRNAGAGRTFDITSDPAANVEGSNGMTNEIFVIIAATIASYIAGSIWYLVIGKHWRQALGWAEGAEPYRPRPVELLVAFVGQLMMAVALSLLIRHLGHASANRGILIGASVWLGFVLPTLATNVVFQRRSLALIWQDGGHWLLLLMVQGAVIGFFR